MPTKRILALDIGTVRIGVAISSLEGGIALPLETIHLKTTPDPIAVIQELLTKENIHHVVVGLPLDLDGTHGSAVRRTKQFVSAMTARIPNIKIYAQDERFTSAVAENTLMQLETKGEKKKMLVDSMAASLILQTWLDKRKSAPTSNENQEKED